MLGLAIEYWYVSVGVAVLAIGFAVYWFGFRAREAVEAAEPSPAIGGGGGASRVTSTGPARPSSQDAVCENCGAAGPGGLFCPDCGAAQALTCSGCGQRGLSSPFCPECGSATYKHPGV